MQVNGLEDDNGLGVSQSFEMSSRNVNEAAELVPHVLSLTSSGTTTYLPNVHTVTRTMKIVVRQLYMTPHLRWGSSSRATGC
jgi:hypothetical protein